MKILIPLICLASLLAGCGQKGDLYHPEDSPPPAVGTSTADPLTQ